jgi:hypothetical protein
MLSDGGMWCFRFPMNGFSMQLKNKETIPDLIETIRQSGEDPVANLADWGDEQRDFKSHLKSWSAIEIMDYLADCP